jgi:tRNA pseudouridine55 synthase
MILQCFIMNKPPGITSSALVQRVRKISGVSKIGHTGTLDQFAEGVLVLPINHATHLSDLFLNMDKTYIAKFKFGKYTDSGDPSGIVTDEVSPEASKDFIDSNFQRIMDEIYNFKNQTIQEAPVISALKIDGRRMSDLYRGGVDLLPKSGPIRIYNVNLLQTQGLEWEVEFRVSRGTYIRKIAQDLSRILNFPIYLSGLKRTSVGEIGCESAIDFESWDKNTQPSLLENWLNIPHLVLTPKEEERLVYGAMPLREKYPIGFFLWKNSMGGSLALAVGSEDGKKFDFRKVFLSPPEI